MKRQRFTGTVVILLLSLQISFTQVNSGGIPQKSLLKAYKNIEVIEMPYFNSVAEEETEISDTNHLKSLKFAKSFEVYYNTKNSGNWTVNSDGSKTWRLGIQSLGAFSLNIIFSEFYLPEGAEVFVYNKEKNYVLGSFTSRNNKESGILPVSPVPGDFLMVDMHVPKVVDFEPIIVIGQVSHDYKNVFKLLKSSNTFGDAGSCNPDIACYSDENYQTIKNSVCRMLVKGNELCSGVLVNNTTEDGKPYLLTANHCIPSEAVATKSIFYFSYESPTCDGPDGSLAYSISGSSLKATKKALDFSLVELSTKPPFEYSPYYAGWNADTTGISSSYSIHHPQGDVKKISFDYDAPTIGNFGGGYDDSAFWHISTWEVGTTEGGSSGAPLFDQDNKVIGTLTGGTAKCSSSKNDYYNMFGRAWSKYEDDVNRLDVWLDPLKEESLYTDGYDPYEEYRAKATYVSNYDENTSFELYKDAEGWGYYTGHSSEGYTQFAESIDLINEVDMLGMKVNTGQVDFVSEFPSVNFKVWQGELKEENVIASKEVLLNNIKEYNTNYIQFDEVKKVSGEIFFGFQINYAEIPDTFSVYHVDKSNASSFYVYTEEEGWNMIGDSRSEFKSTSLALSLLVSGDVQKNIHVDPTSIEKESLSSYIKVYPNPGTDLINIEAEEPIKSVSVFMLNGQQMPVEHFRANENKIQLNTSPLSNGMFFVKIQTASNITSQRFSIIR